MRDYYNDGFNAGYGKGSNSHGDYPKTDQDDYSFRRGYEDGERRRRISEELDRER